MIKLPPREKWFQYILGFTALFVASVAAFFSVMGIGMLFSGAAISSMIMASSLELGKVVATTFLYRYWKKTTKLLKVYLTTAILVLVVITSLGVFGWLSSAYQSSSMQYEMAQQNITMLVEQRGTIDAQVQLSKQRIDNLMKIRNDQEGRMNEALNSPMLSRNPTALRQVQEQNITLINQTDKDISTEKETYNRFVKDTMDMDKKVLEAKIDTSKTKDIITFKFVADAFGLELNSTVKWFIVFIIVVFDPLAVCLILAYNVALFHDKKEEKVVGEEKVEKEVIVSDPLPIEPVKEEPFIEPKLEEVPVTKMLLNEVPVQIDEPRPKEQSDGSLPSHGLRESELLHTPSPEPVRK
jgi:hypothetical protein